MDCNIRTHSLGHKIVLNKFCEKLCQSVFPSSMGSATTNSRARRLSLVFSFSSTAFHRMLRSLHAAGAIGGRNTSCQTSLVFWCNHAESHRSRCISVNSSDMRKPPQRSARLHADDLCFQMIDCHSSSPSFRFLFLLSFRKQWGLATMPISATKLPVAGFCRQLVEYRRLKRRYFL